MIGTATPPIAAPTGKIAWRMFVSSPTVISYLISRPTSKKNKHMKMLMMCASDIEVFALPNPSVISVCQNSKNGPYAGEFATMSEMMAPSSMKPAALVVECVNSRSFK